MESLRMNTRFKFISSVKRNGVRESPTGLGRTIPCEKGTREYQLIFPSARIEKGGVFVHDRQSVRPISDCWLGVTE